MLRHDKDWCGNIKSLPGYSSMGLVPSKVFCLKECCFILCKGLFLSQLEQLILFVLCLLRTLPIIPLVLIGGNCQFPLVASSDFLTRGMETMVVRLEVLSITQVYDHLSLLGDENMGF